MWTSKSSKFCSASPKTRRRWNVTSNANIFKSQSEKSRNRSAGLLKSNETYKVHWLESPSTSTRWEEPLEYSRKKMLRCCTWRQTKRRKRRRKIYGRWSVARLSEGVLEGWTRRRRGASGVRWMHIRVRNEQENRRGKWGRREAGRVEKRVVGKSTNRRERGKRGETDGRQRRLRRVTCGRRTRPRGIRGVAYKFRNFIAVSHAIAKSLYYRRMRPFLPPPSPCLRSVDSTLDCDTILLRCSARLVLTVYPFLYTANNLYQI